MKLKTNLKTKEEIKKIRAKLAKKFDEIHKTKISSEQSSATS